jgi:LuxR family transcriptional regulator, maltose regulon positive regulatory protein
VRQPRTDRRARTSCATCRPLAFPEIYSNLPRLVAGRSQVAKLTRPMLKDLEPRRRLFERLDRLRGESPAVWIAGPAGSGKTSLAASYIDAQSLPVLWYRIDERDQHVEELFFYLRLWAEAQVGSPRGSADLPVFSNNVEIGRFARRFFEALFLQLPPNGLVVFDDYHTAYVGPQWQYAFEKCLASIPAGLHVMVLSRQAPPASLARSFAHGELGVLEGSELLLSEQELAALAKRRVGKERKISAEELSQIYEFTSGWAAGVSLLLRSNRGGSLSALSKRGVETVFDYLSRAVFLELSETVQTLLLHSACLRRFTPSELEELSGVSGARSELLELYRSGFFLESDGPSEEMFRFHPLFRSFLAYRAEQTLGDEQLRSVRARAGRMLQKAGRVDEAFELLLQIDDQAAMCELVLSVARELFAHGRIATLEEWIGKIRSQHLETSSWLSYWHASSLLAIQPSQSLQLFEHALNIFEQEQDGTGAYLAWAGAVQALVYEQRNYQLLERWLERLTQLEHFSPALASAELGSSVVSSLLMGLTMSGADSCVIEHWSGRAMALAAESKDLSVRALTASVLVLGYALRGDSGLATKWLTVLERYSGSGKTTLLGKVAAHAAKAALAWHQGQLTSCLDAAHDGLALLGENRVPMWQLALLVFGSAAARDRRAAAEADGFLTRLADLAGSGLPLEIAGHHSVRGRHAMVFGELKQALVSIELAIDLDRAVGFPYGLGSDLYVAAYLQFELGDEATSRETMREARRIEEMHRQPVLGYWRLLIEADRALRSGEPEHAATLLREAFAIGREKQLYNMECPDRKRVAELCRLALSQDIELEYTRTLVRRKHLFQCLTPLELASWPWPIQVRSLGGLEVRLNDQPLALGRVRTPLLLLKLLLTSAGKRAGLPIGQVLASLWPESDTDNATHAFDMTVLRLRNQLGEHGRRALRVEHGEVLLDTAYCWTDTAALESLLDEVGSLEPETTQSAPQLVRCTLLAERLEALYRGPFAAEEERELPALRDYGAQLRAKASHGARTLKVRFAQLGAAPRAEAMWQRLIDADRLLSAS